MAVSDSGVHGRGWGGQEEKSIVGILNRAVTMAGDRPFLDFSGDEYTYRDIDGLSTRLAHSLAGLGVGHGDRVLSLLDNGVDAVLVWFAVNKLGAVSVPINTAYRGEFLRHQAADAGAEIIICEPAYVERIAAVADGLPRVRLILHRGALTDSRACRIAIEPLDLHRGRDDTAIAPAPQPRDLAMLLYTSGTTGPSKGCMISHNYACNLAKRTLLTSPLVAGETIWTPLPLFHLNAIATTVVATMMVLARASIAPRFSVSQFWPEIDRSGACVATALGSMITLIAQAPDNEAMKRCFGQLRVVRGSPFPAPLQALWRKRFGVNQPGYNGYGMTEAAGVTSLPGGEFAKPGSSGKRNDDFDVRIVDDDDREMPPGEAGEIIVRPLKPHIMFEGYWQRPQDTLKAFRNLWFHTGDIGKFDEDGFFFFVDRKKDCLRRRGENVSSFELESAFLQHPAVREVAVHAVRSDLTEDDIKVTAVLDPGMNLAEEALCRWSLDKLPYFAVPRYIEFRDELPKNAVGRVLKFQLRDEGATPATWDRDKSDIHLEKR